MKLLVLFAVLVAACDGSSDNPEPDAPAGTIDAPAGQPDALVSTPDAPGVDASVGITITTTCERLCPYISTCFMEPLDPMCQTECAADLADCTQPQIEAIYACGDVACAELKNCIGAVACIMG